MKKPSRKPVRFYFSSNKEMLDLYMYVELKYFVYKLLYDDKSS